MNFIYPKYCFTSAFVASLSLAISAVSAISVVQAQSTVFTWQGGNPGADELRNTDNWDPSTAWSAGDTLRFDGSEAGDLDLSFTGAGLNSRMLYDFTASQVGDVTIRIDPNDQGRNFWLGDDSGDTAISIAAGAGKVSYQGAGAAGDMQLFWGDLGTLSSGAQVLTIENDAELEFGEDVRFHINDKSDSHMTLHFSGTGHTTIQSSFANLGSNRLGGVRVQNDHLLTLSGSFEIEHQLSIDQGRVDFTRAEAIGASQDTWRAIRIGNNQADGQGTLRYTGSGAVQVDRQVQIGNGASHFSQTGSATIENESASGALVFGNANFNYAQSGTSAARVLTLGGSNAMDNEILGVIADNDTNAGGTIGVTKADVGKWILSGANTYTGATVVEQGTLAIGNGGSIDHSSGVMVSAGATFDVSGLTAGLTLTSGQSIGGAGTVSGDLNFDSGAHLIFDAAATLMVTGSVSFDDSFGVASLLSADGSGIDWSTIAAGTYTLLENDSNFDNISNFGVENAYDLGDGRSAYFQNGSLELVVVPEPSNYALLGGLLILGWAITRRR